MAFEVLIVSTALRQHRLQIHQKTLVYVNELFLVEIVVFVCDL